MTHKAAFLSATIALCLSAALPAGAEELPQSPGEYTRTLAFDGAERSYILHLPPQYDGHTQLPLLLAFHGGGGNARQLLKSNALAALADREGFILVAPNGSGRFSHRFLTWNVGFGFGYAMQHNIDDIGFVRQLIDTLEAGLRVDRRQVFATGISNGGILCHFLAARLADRIAAIAPIVATVGGKKSADGPMLMPPQPAEPVAVIAFNGMQDEHIPYGGGRQQKSAGEPVYVASAAETQAFWKRANHCSGPPEVEAHEDEQYRLLSYRRGCAGHEVVQYQILDQGHAWPGGRKPRLLADAPSTHVPADELMWAFFKRHPKTEVAH